MAAALMSKFNGLAHRETHLILQRFGAAELILLGDLLSTDVVQSTVKRTEVLTWALWYQNEWRGKCGTPFRIRLKPATFSILGMYL